MSRNLAACLRLAASDAAKENAAQHRLAAGTERPPISLEPHGRSSHCVPLIGRADELPGQPRPAAGRLHQALAQRPSDPLAQPGPARVTPNL